MSVMTASAVIRALDRRRAQNHIASLADLDDTHHEAVAHALAGVPPKARVDVPILIETVREQVRARAEAEAAE